MFYNAGNIHLYTFVPNKFKKLSTIRYHSLIHLGIVDFDGQLPC
jgi:hypothetical protein